MVIYFLESNWKPKHVILGLFEVSKTTWHALTKKLIDRLDEYGLRNKIVT